MRAASILLTSAVSVAGLAGGAEAASVYTKIDEAQCEVLQTYEDGGAALRCPGHGGIDVFVTEGDARLDVDYGVNSGSFETFSAFNNIGDTVEWLTGSDGMAEAAILRFRISADGREAEALVVSRVGAEGAPGCVVGVVDAALEQANGMARGIGAMAPLFDCNSDKVVIASGARPLVRAFTGAHS